MLTLLKVFPRATIHSPSEACIASNTVLPFQSVPLPLPKHLGRHFLLWTISTKYVGGNTHIMVCASHTRYFGHLAYHCMLMFVDLKDLCGLPCGLFADRWDAFCCPCRQVVDSMHVSVEVVHKLHTVVHILPDGLDMLPKMGPMPTKCGWVHLQT